MRITYDFYQRCSKLPADQLAKATGLKVHLFGSLSATGKGHGTERASLAGLIGKEPATVDPLFLDEMIAKPTQSYPVKLGDKTFNLSLADIIYDSPKGDFPHPNTMTCKLLGGRQSGLRAGVYSPGGGFYEWKGYTPPKKGQPKYSYATMKELRQHAEKNNLSVAQLVMANEVAVSGKKEEEINAFLDKIGNAMLATVKAGLSVKEGVLPGPIKLHSKAATVTREPQDDKYESDRAIGSSPLSLSRLGRKRPRAPGHHRAHGRFRGCDAAIVYALVNSKRKLPMEKVREGLLAGAAIGYLCKHNATLSGAEGWLPVGDRRRFRHDGRIHRASDGRLAARHRERRRVSARTSPRNDLRPRGRLRAGALHRALRLRRGEGLDCRHDRHQRNREPASRRSRHHD
jgi:L-serine dehydratase